jgi:diguanylate cyclase (GGDEF)-like protein
MREVDSYFKMVFDFSPDPTAVIDESGQCVNANRNFIKVFGQNMESSFLRSSFRNFNIIKGGFEELLTTDSEIKVTTKDNSSTFCITSQSFYTAESQRLTVLHFKDISEIEREKSQLQQMAIIDDLTGVYNRRYFNTHFSSEINRFRRTKSDGFFSFFIADIDNFKIYNDTYGHSAGDEVLREVAQTIDKRFNRSSDAFFRLGGEEFGAIYISKNINEAVLWAERVRSDVEYLYIEHKGNSGGIVTLSIGLFSASAESLLSVTPDSIYNFADEALYSAKSCGRNRVALYREAELSISSNNIFNAI